MGLWPQAAAAAGAAHGGPLGVHACRARPLALRAASPRAAVSTLVRQGPPCAPPTQPPAPSLVQPPNMAKAAAKGAKGVAKKQEAEALKKAKAAKKAESSSSEVRGRACAPPGPQQRAGPLPGSLAYAGGAIAGGMPGRRRPQPALRPHRAPRPPQSLRLPQESSSSEEESSDEESSEEEEAAKPAKKAAPAKKADSSSSEEESSDDDSSDDEEPAKPAAAATNGAAKVRRRRLRARPALP